MDFSVDQNPGEQRGAGQKEGGASPVKKGEVLGFIIFSVLFVFLFGDSIFLAPLNYFATSVHESMHAIAALLTGGSVHEYAVNADFSGHVISSGGIGWIISMAGYVGVAILAGVLIRFSTSMEISTITVGSLGVIVAGMSIWYSSWFSIGFLLSLAIAALLIFLVWKTRLDSHIAVFLGTFLSFQSLDDINVYLFNYKTGGGYLQTDAYLLSTRLFGTELLTLPVAIFFAAVSLLIWVKFTWGLFKKQKESEAEV